MEKKEMVRCKACGYIMEKAALGDVCPACGVKAQMFEAYEDKVGALRRFLLDKHLHPVIVHAPQAFAFVLVLAAAVYPFLPAAWKFAYLVPFLAVLTWLQPLMVLAGFGSGLVDGKIRYRKITTPLLVLKMILGGAFLLVTTASALIFTLSPKGLEDPTHYILYLVSTLAGLGLSAVLGIKGSTLTHAAMPGDKILMGGKKKPAPKAPAAKE